MRRGVFVESVVESWVCLSLKDGLLHHPYLNKPGSGDESLLRGSLWINSAVIDGGAEYGFGDVSRIAIALLRQCAVEWMKMPGDAVNAPRIQSDFNADPLAE